MKKYNNNLTPDQQISAEERVASIIFSSIDGSDDSYDVPEEEACSLLGKEILKSVLEEFRPDLFTEGS